MKTPKLCVLHQHRVCVSTIAALTGDSRNSSFVFSFLATDLLYLSIHKTTEVGRVHLENVSFILLSKVIHVLNPRFAIL